MVDYKELDELCRQNIEDYDEKVSMAWGYMDRMRCPLRFADKELYDDICDAAMPSRIGAWTMRLTTSVGISMT